MTNRKHVLLVVTLLTLGLISLVFLSACGEEATTTTAAPTTTAGGATTTAGGQVEWGDDLVIGALNSLTGVNAMTGAEQKWAQEQAVADINAAGGVKLNDGKQHKLVLKYADDKSDPTEGAAAMEKLIKVEGLKIILSSNITPVNEAAGIVAEKYQAYYQINTSWTDFIAGHKFKWVSDIFLTPAAAGSVAAEAIAIAPAEIKPTNFAVMVENNPDGQGLGDGAKAALEAKGFKVGAYELFTEGTKDFSSIILKLKQNNIDGMVTLISPADGITFVKQMKEQNWSPKFIFGWKGFWPAEFAQGLGPDADYICHDAFWHESLPYPGAAELGQKFKDSHNGLDTVSAGLPYASVQVLAQAIERAGVFEPGPVRDEVFGGSFKGTVYGDVQYDENGICNTPMLALQWKGGQRVVVYPDVGNKLELFKPWDAR
jgi:branched-chain amino acid transport system substrate-binding protein